MKTFQNLTKGDVILSLHSLMNNSNSRDFSKYVVNNILRQDDDTTDLVCVVINNHKTSTSGKWTINIPNRFLKRTNFSNTYYVLDDVTKGSLVCNNWSEVGKGSILYITTLDLKKKTLEEFTELKVLGISRISKTLWSILTLTNSKEEELFKVSFNNSSSCRYYSKDTDIYYIIGLTKESIISSIQSRLDEKINDQLQRIETLKESTIKLMYLKDSL